MLYRMSDPSDEQPIGRVVGRRTARVGLPPDAITRAAMASMAAYSTGCPKGVFYYDSHEQMTADRLRWTVEAMVARARER
jgi:hypothetical protein